MNRKTLIFALLPLLVISGCENQQSQQQVQTPVPQNPKIEPRVEPNKPAPVEQATPAQPTAATKNAATTTGGPAAPSASPQTTSEAATALDSELQHSMSGYDQMLLREREYVRSRKPANQDDAEAATAETAGGNGANNTGNEDDGAEDEQAANNGSNTDSASADGNKTSNTRPAAAGPGGNNSTPPDLTDSSADDVVARQIREAATKEPDPVLREKLWQEYRRYTKK